ncbi:MAG: hypothetical protein AB7Q23_12640 [Hyphomonadaceae bacterium]
MSQLIALVAVAAGIGVFVVVAVVSMRGPPDRSGRTWRHFLPANDNAARGRDDRAA